MAKTVLITGSSRGIGRETAILFAKSGYNVIINGRKSTGGLRETEEILRDTGCVFMSFQKDVSKFSEISEMYDILSKNNLLPDIIINNAGISHIGLIQDMDIDQWHDIIDTNLSSAFYTTKIFLPNMLHNKWGKIINISSMWGNTGASCEAAYSASKGGLNAFTKALAKELAPSHIQVNAVAFGVVDTSMNAFLEEKDRRELIDEIPAGRMCSSKEAASIIYKVAMLDEYVTGQIITADGALT